MGKQLIVSLISLGGVLFSGFLTYYNSIGACPLMEGCSLLFGIPSCVYGLVIFVLLLLFSIINKELNIVKIISLVGVAFAGATSVIDLVISPSGAYSLGLPSCVYGLAMYIAVFVLCMGGSKKIEAKTPESKSS
jgi:hypothetical protein